MIVSDWESGKMQQEEFGKMISQLLKYVGAKNYALALDLGYDVSYISKIINSKIFPVSKNAGVICEKISSFVMNQAGENTKELLAEYIGVKYNNKGEGRDSDKELERQLIAELYKAYEYSVNKFNAHAQQTGSQESGIQYEEMNSFTVINPRLRRRYLNIPLDESITIENPLDILVIANIFALNKDDKLHLAGIKSSDISNVKPGLMKMRIILNLNYNEEMDPIFDPILIIYMLGNYLCNSFEIYSTNFTFHALALSVKNHFAHFVVQGCDNKCLIATTSRDENVIDDTYEALEEIITTSCQPIFRCYTSEEMILRKQYMRCIIGKNIRILLGTINEIFLPSKIFLRLAKDNFGDNKEIYEELKKIDVVLSNATYDSEMQILLYEQTLNNYVLTGELSFFDKKVKLSVKEREEHIKFMIQLFKDNSNIKVKMIKGYFIEEFKQFDNPNIFLSSISNYLRINTENTDKKLLVIKDKKMDKIFENFFVEAWNNRADVVSDTAVIQTIEVSLNYIELLGLGITI